MKTLIMIVLCMMGVLYAQTAVLPQGAGTAESPYLIANLENLYWITQDSTRWDDNYLQTSDIDASETQNWFGGLGWLPIALTGDFIGTYDGANYKISDLSMHRDTYNVYHGLFSSLNNATVKNLRLNRINYRTLNLTGGIAGFAQFSQFDNCHVSGDIIGGSVSGLVQKLHFSVIKNCSFNGLINNLNSQSGGLVGYCHGSCIKESYVNVQLIGGHENTGGLIGFSAINKIINCYSQGEIFGSDNVGGLTGFSYVDSIFFCYSNAKVKGQDYINPLIGENYERNFVQYCFWNTTTTEIDSSEFGIGLNNEEMRNIQNYLTQNWDFSDESVNGTEDIWRMEGDQNNGFPFLNHLNYMDLPNIRVIEVTEITTNSATITTNLSFTYNNGILYHGICYSTETSPSIINSNYLLFGNQPSIGNTTANLAQLSINTLYYVRGFVITANDTLYSGDMFFNTLPIEIQTPQGSGTAEDPYQIDSKHHLLWLSLNPESWSKDFIQTSDISLRGSDQWFLDVFGYYRCFKPIGDILVPFMGNYDGQGHSINDITIKHDSRYYYTGLFGLVGNDKLVYELKTIKNIVMNDARVNGSIHVGILAGRIYRYRIESCSVNGLVIGRVMAAGLIGRARYSEISKSSSNATIYGGAGFCGEAIYSNIDNCYSKGQLTIYSNCSSGFSNSEGNSNITNSFCAMIMILGDADDPIIYPFSNSGSINNCFYDQDLYTFLPNQVATGLSTEEMKNINNYLEADWNFDTIWAINETNNDGYPYLQWQNNPISTSEITIHPNISRIQSIYPNPFNPSCTIAFEIGKTTPVQIDVFNIKGQKVNHLFEGTLNQGIHKIEWNGKDDHQRSCSSGIYFIRMQNQGQQYYRKIMMIK